MDWVVLSLLIVAFLCGMVVPVCLYFVVDLQVKRKLMSERNKVANSASQDKKATLKAGKAVLMLELGSILKKEGKIQEKLPLIATALTNNPDGAEAVFNDLQRFL
jgi:hypothetical protein